MKRSALHPSPMPARKTALRAKQQMRRRTVIKPVNRARKEKLHEHQYGPAGYGDWLRSLGCVVAGCNDERIEMAHTTSRGAGGSWRDAVPMCTSHHSSLHALGIVTFQRRHGLDLADLAGATVLRWRAFSDQTEVDEPGALVVHEGVTEDRPELLQLREDPAGRLADMDEPLVSAVLHTPSSR